MIGECFACWLPVVPSPSEDSGLQASGSLGTKEVTAQPQEERQRLEALQKEQEGLKRQLVDLQRSEAAHLQTISELKDSHGKSLSSSSASAESKLAAVMAEKEVAEARVGPLVMACCIN